ncbi:MAG: hypothetical protein HYX65_02860 [Gemmatimonadetes bacterium]|nr:hypothetical protein [Gemmatimonadota bacterium]
MPRPPWSPVARGARVPRLVVALAACSLAAAPVAAQPVGESLIVLNKAEATASVIDLGTGRVAFTLPVGNGPHEVAVSLDGGTAVACNYGTAQAPGSTLTVLDLAGRKVERTVDLGAYRRPHGIAWLPDNRRVVVTVEANQAVLVVDVRAGTVERTIATNEAGTHLLVRSRDGSRVYTANIGAGSVSMIDVAKGTLLKSTHLGKGPEAIDLSPDGRELWAADWPAERVFMLDARTLDTLASAPTGKRSNRLKFTPDGRHVLLSNAQSGYVGIYDVKRRTEVAQIPFAVDSALLRPQMLGGQMGNSATPLGIVMHPSGARAWVALAAMDRIAEVDVEKRTVVRLLQAGREPDGMALIPGRR